MGIKQSKIMIGPGFLLMMTAVIFFVGFRAALFVLLAVVIHEFGHAAAILICGGKLDGLRAGAGGMKIIYSGSFSYGDDAIVALAGPVMSILAAIMASWAGRLTGLDAYIIFSGVSICYFLLNMIPARITDGGKALYAFVSKSFDPFTAEKLQTILDIICFLLLIIAGVYVFAKSNGNLTLFLCAILLAEACCKSGKSGVKFHK